MLKGLTLAVTALLPIGATAATVGGFSELVVFGDSLSDPFVEGLPAGIYPNSQFTNGDTWAVQLGADLASGRNFAQAGATALTTDDGIDDFAQQLTSYAASGLGMDETTLAAVWFGGNDVGSAIQSPDPAARLAEGLDAIVTGLTTMVGLGFENVLVFGLPDVGATPRIRAFGDAASEGASGLTLAYNSSLEAIVGSFEPVLNIAYVDILGETAPFITAPSSTFTNTEDACFDGVASFCGPMAGATYLYHDPFHPTELAHSLVADIAVSAANDLAPVPLPASGLLLIGALGVAGLRRRS